MNLHASWKLYFDNLETNSVSNQNLNIFTKATMITEDTTDSALIRSLTEDADSVIITVAPVTGKIKFLHSPTNLGGTRIRPENKLVALDGFGDKSIPVLIDEKCMTSTVDIRTPSFNSLRTLTTTEEIKNSSIPNTGQKNFNHASFVILPPFIVEHIVDQDTREPEELSVNCSALIEAHDQAHLSDTLYNKASEN